MTRALLTGLLAMAMNACAAGAAPQAPAAAKAEGKKELRLIALRNPGFENAPRKLERCPEGWECTMHSNPESFVFKVETAEGAQGRQALCVERVLPEPWALVTQSIPGAVHRGAALRFSLALRIDRAEGEGAGPWAVVHGPFGNLAHEERVVKATGGWQRVAVDFSVGATAQTVEVGATLLGGGRICIDDARLEVRAP